MTRYTVKLTMRRRPWFVRAYRRLRYPSGRWPEMESGPWWRYWFANMVPFRLRGLHRAYALTHGYFWLPCPLCGQPFGGHEWREVAGRIASVPDPTKPPPGPMGPFSSVGICPRCTRAGKGVDVAWSELEVL